MRITRELTHSPVGGPDWPYTALLVVVFRGAHTAVVAINHAIALDMHVTAVSGAPPAEALPSRFSSCKVGDMVGVARRQWCNSCFARYSGVDWRKQKVGLAVEALELEKLPRMLTRSPRSGYVLPLRQLEP